MYQIYSFIHLYPRRRQCKRALDLCSFSFQNNLLPIMFNFAENLNEVHWEDRLSPWNHTPLFPKYYFIHN
jgi:hypothetical protein